MRTAILMSFVLLLMGPRAAFSASCCHAAPVDGQVHAEESVYNLTATWTNQLGKTVSLATLKGKPRLITMFFASCTYACPRIAADIVRLHGLLGPEERERLGVVMVSLDPERDSPAALVEFVSRNNLGGIDPLMLTGSASDVRSLAALLGVRYRKEANGDISHSSKLVLLDAEGVIVEVIEGLGAEPAPLVDALRSLGSGKP